MVRQNFGPVAGVPASAFPMLENVGDGEATVQPFGMAVKVATAAKFSSQEVSAGQVSPYFHKLTVV